MLKKGLKDVSQSHRSNQRLLLYILVYNYERIYFHIASTVGTGYWQWIMSQMGNTVPIQLTARSTKYTIYRSQPAVLPEQQEQKIAAANIQSLPYRPMLFTCTYYSRCNITINPIIPRSTVFSHGCSLSMIVTYPTMGMYPRTLPTISSWRLR